MDKYNILIINITGGLIGLFVLIYFLLIILTITGLRLINNRKFCYCSSFKLSKASKKRCGAILVLICLSIGYALTLGNVISISINDYSVTINWWPLFIYTLLSFYTFAFASLFFTELSKHKDL